MKAHTTRISSLLLNACLLLFPTPPGSNSLYLATGALGLHSSATPSDLETRVHEALLLERPNAVPCTAPPKAPACPPSKFRAPTGECNNVINRSWAARGDTLLRLLPANYADGRSQPRSSVGSHALPAPDVVVQTLQAGIDARVAHPHITAMLPSWGQLLSYDLVQITAPSTQLKCCPTAATTSSEKIDQCYVRAGAGCKEYKRSVPSHEAGSCEFSERNQMNAASGFVDGSGLYGATEREFQALRTYQSGRVDLKACPRCNEHGSVGALHTLLLNEHNRIADVLSKLNPSWSDTTLFLEARRAVTAQIQHITYNEFLPIILGQQIASKDSLKMVFGKHYNGYSSAIRSGVFNEVAVAALPAFLTMLPVDMVSGYGLDLLPAGY